MPASRRLFLNLRRAATRLRGGPAASEPTGALPPAGALRKKVAVVGAGLAGLAAAFELRKAGHAVLVLEARRRPGGRALTLRDEGDEGLHAEAGPARFRDDHHLVLAYLDRFGLKYSPFYPERGSIVACAEGQRVFQGPIGTGRGWLVAGSRRESVSSWLRLYGEIAPQFGVGVDRRPWRRPTLFRIRGGTDLLPRALAAELKDEIEYDAPVLEIAQSERTVSISTAGPEGTLRRDFDRVICCVPAPALERITLTPPLTTAKREALGRLRYESAARVFLRVKRRRWHAEGLSGFGAADDLGEVWDSNFDRIESSSMLTVYAKGPLARRLGEMRPESRVATTVGRLGCVLPGVADDVERGDSFCWDEEQWSWGGWPALRDSATNEDRSAVLQSLRAPEGLVHFAGDHTAVQWLAWMEGALESGRRVAREVHSAAQGPPTRWRS